MAAAAALIPAEFLWLQLRDLRLHAAVAGPADGPLVILLHGFPEFWYGWRRQIGALAAAGWRVVAPDQRGYNLSDKPAGIAAYRLDALADDIVGIAESLGRRQFSIIGHDWGGVVAWRLAAREPQLVTRAAILNAPHPATLRSYARRHPSQALKSWYVGFFRLPAMPELALEAAGFWALRRVMRRTSRPGTFSGADFSQYRTAWSQSHALSAMLNWYRALRLGTGRSSAPIRIPVRLIWGDHDAFLDPGLAEAGAALCDRCEVFHLPGATHWVQHEEPGEVNRLLVEFLG